MTKFIINVIVVLCYVAGAVWGIVEGVDYFVNENPVSWMFLIPLLTGIGVMLANIIYVMKN